MAGWIVPEPLRFHDGGLLNKPDQPADPPTPGELRISLDRMVSARGKEGFTLVRRIAYDDRQFGQILVPNKAVELLSDLTSVPALFTWLIPKTGRHLPATLLHDGLVLNKGEPETYTWEQNRPITRVEADRVLRDAMADSGTKLARRWLVWSAVTLGTMVAGVHTGWSPLNRLVKFVVALGSLLAITYLGYCAMADLFDRHWWGAVGLPWMGERPWYQEFLGGLCAAIVVPLIIGLLWGKQMIAGWVSGVALAVLLPVMVPIVLVAVVYQLVELFANARVRWLRYLVLAVAIALVVAAAVVVTVLFLE
jgi:Protein of unknown function (DUF1353)